MNGGTEKVSNLLGERHDLFDVLMDALPFKFFIVDREMRVVAWNRKAEEGTPGVKGGKSLSSGRKITNDFEEVFQRGAVLRGDEESTLKGGEKKHYRVTKTPLHLDEEGGEGGEGVVSHVAVFMEDVTEKHRME
ncbi:MAG: PAS domain-containing protein, partial [Thermodesulfobacteriota bacterium]